MSLEEARAKSLAIWNEMAQGWDRKSQYLWDTSRKVGEWMVDRLSLQPGQTVLELAAGPGMTGFVAAKLIAPEGKLISTDFSPKMLELAKRTAAGSGVTNVEFRHVDAENIDMRDDSVDAVLCRWGYMLMMDPQKALKETRRVLKPGGKLAFSVWGSPQENLWASVPGMVMVSLGKMELPDPNAPGGVFSMGDPARVELMLKEAGFDRWQIDPMRVDWTFADDDEAWSFMNEVAGAISLLLKEMDEQSLQEIRDELRVQLQNFRSDKGYSVPGVALNVVAE